MKLQILGSGSSGNCYILGNDSTAMVIECGVDIKKIKQGLDFNLSKVAGALVSHEHLDHSKSGEEMMAAGIKVYCSKGTAEAMGWKSHRLNLMKKMTKYHIGQFKVMPFDVKHDCKEPFGFYIHHPQCGNVLFVTDSFYVPHTFKNLNNILVEANYCEDIVKERMAAASIHGKVRDRVIESHMSIGTCKDMLMSNDLQYVNNIVLIHLSDGNSNAASFQKQVEELTGKTVHIASKGMEINLSKTPF